MYMLHDIQNVPVYVCLFVCLMVFNATFNNISVISRRSVYEISLVLVWYFFQYRNHVYM